MTDTDTFVNKIMQKKKFKNEHSKFGTQWESEPKKNNEIFPICVK